MDQQVHEKWSKTARNQRKRPWFKVLNDLLMGFLLKNSGIERDVLEILEILKMDEFALVKNSLSIRVGNN